ncbi:MAG TPA: DNA replication and repair protein RecF [Chitinophagaceae bacterium]|jgi:DNA replication and repair protein RecF|nr:DNA replication and repair protein RecF [Chitinophagaceae bacterium]
MLRLNAVSLVQFKNYLNRSIRFTERIVGISGRNGVGKTNLLDAIHYLCFTKSYFTRIDGNNILQGHDGFRLEGEFEIWDKQEKAICILRETGKKEFLINDQSYEKFSQHIGHYPCVIIAPDDIQIITDGSEERRRFIDTLLSQLDADYLQQLIIYNKILQQRNSLLRSFAETGNKDLSLLTVLDEQLVKPGEKILKKRSEFLVSFLPLAKQLYTEIAGQFENINLYYDSELLKTSFSELLKENQTKDIMAIRTTSGIHRDDLEFNLNEQPFKNIASQGQRKSLLFALKLAEMEVLKNEKGIAPILLLDDVFEKLDEERITQLLRRVCIENDGQVFITDTNEVRIREHLDIFEMTYQQINL